MLKLDFLGTARVQLWSCGDRSMNLIFDPSTQTFQRENFPPRGVFVSVFVHGMPRGYLSIPFPPAEETGLLMHTPALGVRYWEGARLVRHQILTWDMLAYGRQLPPSMIVTAYQGIGKRCSPSATRPPMQPRAIPFTPVVALARIPDEPPLLSAYHAFVFRDPVATERWFRARLGCAVRLVAGVESLLQVKEQDEKLWEIVSFIVACPPDGGFQRFAAPLALIDSVCARPRASADVTCFAYHLLMTLIFTKWNDFVVGFFRERVLEVMGFPYVASGSTGYWLLMVGATEMRARGLISERAKHPRLAQASTAGGFKPLYSFSTRGGSDVTPHSKLQRLPPPTIDGGYTHIYGNAHEILDPEQERRHSACAFSRQNGEFIPARTTSRMEEEALIERWGGVAIPRNDVSPLERESQPLVNGAVYRWLGTPTELEQLRTDLAEKSKLSLRLENVGDDGAFVTIGVETKGRGTTGWWWSSYSTA